MANGEGSELGRKLQKLEDIEEIKKLKARYCAACDGGWAGTQSHDIDAIVSLFAEDAVWDGGPFGQREGRAALRAYYEGNSAANPSLAFHLLTNPIIEVDGDAATGNWHLTILLTLADGASTLVGGVFEDVYARTPDGWRIKRSRFQLALSGTYEHAWSVGPAG